MLKNLNIDYKKLMLCFSIGSTITLGTITCDSIKYNDDTFNRVEDVHYDNEDLLNVFESEYSNTTLNSLFNSVSDNLSNFILEYGDYLNQDRILNSMNNLKVIVDSNNQFDNYISYDASLNRMNINKSIFYESSRKIEEEKLEAGLKFLFQSQLENEILFSGDLGHSLDEGFISLLLREYGYDDKVDSKKEDYVRILCELVGKDNFFKAQASNDINIIEDSIDNYIGKGNAKKFLKAIDCACADNNYGNENDNDVWEYIDKIYFAKNNVSIGDSEDYAMKIYANKFFIKNYDIPGARTNINAILDKNYFINVDEAVIRYYQYNILYGTVTLGNDNEIVSGRVLVDGFYNNDTVVDYFGNEIETEEIIFGDSQKKK